MLTHQQKLDFVLKMTKHALSSVQHFDSGGTVIPTGASPTPGSVGGDTTQGSVGSIPSFLASGFTNPIGSVAGTAKNIGQQFTVQNGYQASLAPTTQVDYTAPLATAEGHLNSGYYQNQDVLNQQQALARQLEAESLGKGPNPAQAALNQNTGENIKQAAALAASTRGAGANAGLVANNAANMAATTQQNAIGQAATLQAQQQLNAQQQLQAQQQAEGNTVQGEQNIQGNLFGASANANNAQNNSAISNYGQAQGINSQVAQNNANAVNKTTGGLLQGAGTALAALFAEGGKVEPHMDHMAKIYYPHLYEGGSVDFGVGSPSSPNVSSPNLITQDKDDGKNSGAGAGLGSIGESIGGSMAKGGKVGEKLKEGGKVPGKPKVNHDAYKNDTVSAKLSPGEVVIDLDTLKDKGKLGQMARFVASTIEKKKMGRAL